MSEDSTSDRMPYLHLHHQRPALILNCCLDGLDRTLEAVHGSILRPQSQPVALYTLALNDNSHAHLVSRVRAQDIQWRGDELCLDRDRLVALRFTCPQRLLDSVDAGGGIAGQLDIRTEFDRLGRQSSCDRAEQDAEHGGLYGVRQ